MQIGHSINVRAYDPSDRELWDSVVKESRNGTFLFLRGFMDYHSDRFSDCSLLFEKNGKVVGCFPANYSSSDDCVYSHQGLTYGGLTVLRSVTSSEMVEMFDLLISHYHQTYGRCILVYKPIPHIYHSYPSDDDLYCLFRHGGNLVSRSLSSCIDLLHPVGMNELRRRCVAKGRRVGLEVVEVSDKSSYMSYWHLLSACLESGHGVRPVHSAEEMLLLSDRFRANISLYVSRTSSGEIVSGVWLFKCGDVLHTQYLASSPKGKECGGLDLIISEIIRRYSTDFRYLDFGISTEDGGRILNSGLLFQKEGFGGRGICYDSYRVDL